MRPPTPCGSGPPARAPDDAANASRYKPTQVHPTVGTSDVPRVQALQHCHLIRRWCTDMEASASSTKTRRARPSRPANAALQQPSSRWSVCKAIGTPVHLNKPPKTQHVSIWPAAVVALQSSPFFFFLATDQTDRQIQDGRLCDSKDDAWPGPRDCSGWIAC